MFATREPTIEALRAAPVKLRYKVNGKVRKVLMDSLTASAMVAVYDVLSEPHKKTFEERLADHLWLNKLSSFCLSKCSFTSKP